MRLPEELHDAIAAQAARFPVAELARASREVSARYQADKPLGGTWKSEAHRIAYLVARMPATYAATARVLQELRRVLPQVEMRTLLDLGAGPGTATWAAASVFPQLQQATLLERDLPMLKLGRTLTSAAGPLLSRATWVDADLARTASFDPHDLVVLSYVLGEMPEAARIRVLEAAWAAAEILMIIEPGTPKRFAIVLDARARSIGAGAQLLAPCPHSSICPLAKKDDWCHFAARVERSSLHRRLKDAELGHEDEKFSYLIACKPSVMAANAPPPVAEARIIRRPAVHSGHVQLTLCTPAGIKEQTTTRSQEPAYRQARRAEWGDAWPLPSAE